VTFNAPSPSFLKIYLYAVVTSASGVDYATSEMLVSRIAMREWILLASRRIARTFTQCGQSGDREGRQARNVPVPYT